MTAALAHDDAGEGPAVVLIHGHPFNRSMWTPQLAALRDSFRVIIPDLRGYGDSPVTPGTVPMAQLAADVRHLLDAKGIATAALAGLSMGGLVVMELAAAQPHRWWAYGFIATTAQRVTADEQQARRATCPTSSAPATSTSTCWASSPAPVPARVPNLSRVVAARERHRTLVLLRNWPCRTVRHRWVETLTGAGGFGANRSGFPVSQGI
jgi:pimeloyl-ACP methyl ester carboxylesterase